MNVEERPIIVFDALCLLCSAHAQWVVKHDRKGRFRLASVQSATGAFLCRRFGIDPADPMSILLVEGGRARVDSDAILAILSGLGGVRRVAAAAARLVPAFLRDRLYRLIARNRFRLFGRRETCWLPDPAFRDRFL